MTAPDVQIGLNSSVIEFFWDADISVNGGSFNLYTAVNKAGPFTLSMAASNIPNYGKKAVKVRFIRADHGFTINNSFYAVLTFVTPQGVEGPQGNVRFVSALADQAVSAGAANSPLTVSERFKVTVTTTPLRVLFSADAKQIEVFNLSKDSEIYVDVTGLDASVAESMPVMPYGYYALGVHVSKNTGISMVTPGGPNDVRIVVHY